MTPIYLFTEGSLRWIISGFILQALRRRELRPEPHLPVANASRPRCARRPRASSIIRARSGPASWRRCSRYFAIERNMGFALPMMVSTTVFLVLVVIAVALGPETKGKRLIADLELSRRPTDAPRVARPFPPRRRGEGSGTLLADQRIHICSLYWHAGCWRSRRGNATRSRECPMCKGDDQNCPDFELHRRKLLEDGAPNGVVP